MSAIIDENERYHGQFLTQSEQEEGPIRVRLVPAERYASDRSLRLGPINLCEPAADWLRVTFPDGGTFREAYERCPFGGSWLGYVIDTISSEVGEYADCNWGLSADHLRERYPYEQIESWIRRVMKGRPEVIG